MRIILAGSIPIDVVSGGIPLPLLSELEKPTLLVNPRIVRENIAFMADKARQQNVRFRPHFKTHQSAAVGEWFNEAGVKAITVSSVDMADYFARHGWKDILIAFPVNVRQLRTINSLASQVRLGLLVESVESVHQLASGLQFPVDLWIKVDSGSGRTGLVWNRLPEIKLLAETITTGSNFTLRGLLTHAGYTYSSTSREDICQRYQTSVSRMIKLQSELAAAGLGPIEISVGDTPGCTVCSDLGRVDEIRPGNFVFYDGQMLHLGVCTPRQIAAVLACPVVALHPERGEVVVYGGAVHLSKDTIIQDGIAHFGLVVFLSENGEWSEPVPQAYAARLSQEHGILHLPPEGIQRLKVGDWLGVLPAHICLTVACMGRYRLLDGTEITTYRSSELA
ncbi:MAG: alanine racemase [Bellilinea sp.]